MKNSPQSYRTLMEVEEARSAILNRCKTLEAIELPLDACLGRILRESVTFPFDMPPFDRSAMDGYALAGETRDKTHTLVGTIAAGDSNLPHLKPGECVRIFTGAPLPPGADRVVMQEESVATEKTIAVKTAVAQGSHIRRRAEDGAKGSLLLENSQILTPVQLGLAASAGRAALEVSRPPRIWILGTGSELVAPGLPLGPGQIYNSNSPQLAAQVRSFGGEPHCTTILDDKPDSIAAQIRQALEAKADMICVSGGASVGDADFSSTALTACGFETHFHGVNLKPGKPLLFATCKNTLAFAIPGNPVSHLVVFALFIAPALRALQGLPPTPFLTAHLAKSWKGPSDHRNRWLPATVILDKGSMKLHILSWKGSGDLPGCRNANAIINLQPEVTELALGAEVTYTPLTGDTISG